MATVTGSLNANANLSSAAGPRIVHKFVSGVDNGADATKVRPTDWGANHTIVNLFTFNWTSGTSMPANPSTNDRITRTDLGLDFYWDGTRWLSTTIYEWVFIVHDAVFGSTGLTATGTPQRGNTPMLRGGSDIWLVGWQMGFFVQSGASALGASHKWVGTVAYVQDSTAGTTDNGPTINIDSGASGQYRQLTGSIGALLNNGTQHDTTLCTWTKTGTPGNLRIVAGPTLSYRIVAT